MSRMWRPLLFKSIPVISLAAGLWAGHAWWPAKAADATATGGKLSGMEGKPGFSDSAPPQQSPGPEMSKMLGFLQRLEDAEAAEFPALWDEWHAQNADSSPAEGGQSVEELLIASRWAEMDPVAACAFFSNTGEQAALLKKVFGVWALSDPEAAEAAIGGLDGIPARSAALTGVILSAGDDPHELNKWFRRLAKMPGFPPTGWNLPDTLTVGLLEEAAALDPSASQELAGVMGAALSFRLEAIAVARTAAADLPGALAMIEALPFDAQTDRSDRATRFFADLYGLGQSDPAKLAALMEGLNAKCGPGWLKDNDDLPTKPVIEALAIAAPDKIRGLLSTAFPAGTGSALIREDMARDLFETNPRAALEVAPSGGTWVLDFLSGKFTFPDLATLPVPPLELLQNAPPSPLRTALLRAVLPEMAANSPQAAAEWVAGLPEGKLRVLAASILEPGGGLSDLETAALMAGEGETDGNNLSDVTGIASRLASEDPARASEQVTSLPPGAARDAAIGKIGEVWAERATGEALQWAMTLDDGSREHALAGILKPWAENEPGPASEFIAALPAGAGHGLPVAAFAGGLAAVDPEAALQWAATIENSDRRQTVFTEIAPSLLKNHPKEAAAIVRGLPGLSDAERELILKAAPSP